MMVESHKMYKIFINSVAILNRKGLVDLI